VIFLPEAGASALCVELDALLLLLFPLLLFEQPAAKVAISMVVKAIAIGFLIFLVNQFIV
jgi:hypothetical protein